MGNQHCFGDVAMHKSVMMLQPSCNGITALRHGQSPLQLENKIKNLLGTVYITISFWQACMSL